MTQAPIASCEEIREWLSYDPTTGDLVWRKNTLNKGAAAGSIAGWKNNREARSYRQVEVLGRVYLAHRIIWLIVTGEWPPLQIDHKNGDGLDNRWSNLRLATKKQNSQNSRRRNDNTSGHRGVHWHAGAQKWRAQIWVAGKRVHLGFFSDVEEAAAVYRRACLAGHGEFAAFRVAEEAA